MSSFADKLSGMVSSTFVGLALTLSKDVGILQVLLDARKPLTSHEIAGKGDLKERYVRELLDSLATAELIHASFSEAGSLVYHIEEDEKKAFKTDTMAFMSFPIGMMKAYDQIKTCVHSDGPLGLRLSPEFHDSLVEFGSYHFDEYVTTLLKCVDGLKAKLENGIDFIEVGCGRGLLLAKLAQMFVNSTFTASDNTESLLDELKASLGHIPNIRYAFLDVCSTDTPSSKQYDWVHCAFVIHDVPNPPQAFKNIRKLVKPGGNFTMIEMAPSGSVSADTGNIYVAGMYALSSFACVAESYQREDSHAMGMCWGKHNIIEALTSAGFEVKIIDIQFPISMFICK